jgi:hypothetical protein
VQVVVDNVHVQFVPEMAVTVNPVGGSATVTVPLVAAVPVLVTWIVYVAFCWPLLKFPCVVTLADSAGVPDCPPPPLLPAPVQAARTTATRQANPSAKNGSLFFDRATPFATSE